MAETNMIYISDNWATIDLRAEFYQCSTAKRGEDLLAPAAATFFTAGDFFPFFETGFSSSA